jgi:hypothetical protein
MTVARIACDEGDTMTHFDRQLALALLTAISMLVPAAAAAPPPNAPPGTICVTPKGWCKAEKPGPPGAPCACPTTSGWVQGTLK